MLIYGLGGAALPFIGIKAIDMLCLFLLVGECSRNDDKAKYNGHVNTYKSY